MDQKPEYFANGDFEETVANIIASPRRLNGGRAYSSAAHHCDEASSRLYDMSDEQKQYYKRCFGQLHRAVQGSLDFDGALWGGDQCVVDFFKKSGLDTSTLSRVWAMADANADGWLDFGEFAVAMHLIVLRVKGGLDVPDCLPTHLIPPLNPPRAPPTPVLANNRNATAHAWSNFDESMVDGGNSTRMSHLHHHHHQHQQQQQYHDHPENHSTALGPANSITVAPQSSSLLHAPHSQSAEGLHLHAKMDAPVPHFSDVPPLLVDGRPTAIKATASRPEMAATHTAQLHTSKAAEMAAQLLALKSPQGPPPQPPPRPSARGHARSASLDLRSIGNQLILGSQGLNGGSAKLHTAEVEEKNSPEDGSSSSGSGNFRPMSTSCHGTTQQLQPAVPARPQGAFAAVSSTVIAAPPSIALGPLAVGLSASSSSSSSTAAAPPLPSPPITPRKRSVVTQTEEPFTSREDFEHFIKEFLSCKDDLIGSETVSLEALLKGCSGAERWKARCHGLRRQNAELEQERMRLAQVRIQLELRLQELQGVELKPTPKPTAL